MSFLGRIFSTQFGSALAGGLVVAVAGLIAIETGVIDDGSEPAVQGLTSGGTSQLAVSGEEGLTVNEIYRRDNEGVAFISASVSRPSSSPFDLGPQQGTATGSGFLIDDRGHILTNAHVVEGASAIQVNLGDSDEAVDAELIGADPSSDVALLKIDSDQVGVRPLQFGDSGDVKVGDPVVAIGNPFGLDRTVTTGIVSALQREIQAPNGFAITDVIQTDAAINPGNSGGPLLDAAGRVIGINSQIASQSGGSEGIGFAVPISTARSVAEQLISDGVVRRAYLGVSGVTIDPEVASALDLPVEEGAMVANVVPGGPADRAGLRGPEGEASIGGQVMPIGGDIIIAVDGEDVNGFDRVAAIVDERKPGDKLTLTVLRDGDELEIEVTLGNRPDSAQGPQAP